MNTNKIIILVLSVLASINSYSMNRGGSALKNNLSKAFAGLNLAIDRPYALSKNDFKRLQQQFRILYHPDKYGTDRFRKEQADIKLNEVLEAFSIIERSYNFKDKNLTNKELQRLINLIKESQRQWEENLEEEKEFAEFKKEEERHAQEQQEVHRQNRLKNLLRLKRLVCVLGAGSFLGFALYVYEQEFLIQAINDNDCEAIYKNLIKLKFFADVECKDKDDNSIFHIACKNKDIRLIEYLIDNYPKLKTYQLNKERKSPLELLAQSVDYKVFREVLKKINKQNEVIYSSVRFFSHKDNGERYNFKKILNKVKDRACKYYYWEHRESIKNNLLERTQDKDNRSLALNLAIEHKDYELIAFLGDDDLKPSSKLPWNWELITMGDPFLLKFLNECRLLKDLDEHVIYNIVSFKRVDLIKDHFTSTHRSAFLKALSERSRSNPEYLEMLLMVYDPLQKDLIESKEDLQKQIENNSDNLIAKVLLVLKNKDLARDDIKNLWNEYKSQSNRRHKIKNMFLGTKEDIIKFVNEKLTQEDREFIQSKEMNGLSILLLRAIQDNDKDFLVFLLKHVYSVKSINENKYLFCVKNKEIAQLLIDDFKADATVENAVGENLLFYCLKNFQCDTDLCRYYFSFPALKKEALNRKLNLWHEFADSCLYQEETQLLEKAALLHNQDPQGFKNKDKDNKTPCDRAFDWGVKSRHDQCKKLADYFREMADKSLT